MAGLHGIINFDKPTGITSAKALYKVRSITRQRKSGHAGTLDPAASGVLVLCLGRATKLVERIMDQPKVYRATARLDVTSDSFDLDRPLIPAPVRSVPDLDTMRATCAEFEGAIQQVPPSISAVKVGGRPAYKHAARGKPVELAARPVHIYWLYLHAFRYPEIEFEACCGRGMYVRALIRDLGERLGTGGCLTSLVRRRVGPFHQSEAWSLDRLKAAADPSEYLIDLSQAQQFLAPEAMVIPPRPSDPPRSS
jgi:tRNA pseudouridine55 synthase